MAFQKMCSGEKSLIEYMEVSVNGPAVVLVVMD